MRRLFLDEPLATSAACRCGRMMTPVTGASFGAMAARYPNRTNGSWKRVWAVYGPDQPGYAAGSAPSTWSYTSTYSKPRSSAACA